jgi:hypothetical protein
MTQRRPVFLVGHYRSGSTMFWSMLRSATDTYQAFYEPFHEDLLTIVDDGGIVPIDPSHHPVEDKFAEFRVLNRQTLGTLWRPWFGRERFLMEREDEAPDMEAYLRFLIDSTPLRPMMKFTRATFRVKWLRETFPDANIIQLAREPRAIWASMWKQDEQISATFIRNTQIIVQDLGLDIPGDPYRLFYAAMLLADEMCEEVVDDRWEYEAAVSNFASWGTRHLVEAGLLRAIPPIAMRGDSTDPEGPHDARWYDEQEQAVRSIVGDSVLRILSRG